jgi:hypothetical protein
MEKKQTTKVIIEILSLKATAHPVSEEAFGLKA